MYRAFVTALRTLTILRVPGSDAASFHCSLPFFPLVGALLGGMVWAVGSGMVVGIGGSIEIAAFFCVGISTVLTGGIHLDGLADSADGLLCMASRERRLEIMKDSTVGTYGALAIVFAVLLKWICYGVLLGSTVHYLIVVVFVISRTVQVELATSCNSARDGKGTGGVFIEGAGTKQRVLAWAISLLITGWMGPVALLLLPIGFVGARIMAAFFTRKVGGVTGDLLGASGEMTEALLLFISSAVVQTLDSRWGAEWLASPTVNFFLS
ncbi:MAG: adenosylcobinamide-GDP ribazoletransferase [Deltaproteobacteria bacterium]|nr:adenosylcobinamide-GDP ribazoletransferase [Deltaproteobacteria bacterium]MBN2674510.1 adenosylcobinamide-GDP ribazoletransferase [Deltaproteobacteria bacterium]